MELWDMVKSWLSKSDCKNNSGHEVLICRDNAPYIMQDGETVPDCDGVVYIDKNGRPAAIKIHGKKGTISKHDEAWMRDENEVGWTKCADKALELTGKPAVKEPHMEPWRPFGRDIGK